uniref:Uncharacterized protein n=1 Tax=Lygus hesperus TaxID=30085 RepID=A0A0K8SEN2_LYGHE
MFKGRFCCCFSLQAGVCMYSSMGLVQMICIFITNIGGEIHVLDHGHELTQFSILYIYVMAMFAGFGLTYFGTVKPSLKCLKIGNWIVLIFLLYWMIIACLSFINRPDVVHSLCIDRRCPDTQWLVKTYFRTYGNDCYEGEDPLIGDEDLMEDGDKERGENYTIHKTDEIGEIGIEENGEENPEVLNTTTIPPEDFLSIDYFESGSAENMSQAPIEELDENSTSYSPGRMYQNPELEGLDLISFESRLIGCTTDIRLYKILSIFAMICWATFVVHGLVGALFLIRQSEGCR